MAAVVTITTPTVNLGAPVSFLVTGGPGNVLDWVALYEIGAPNTPNPTQWCYLNGMKTAPPVGLTAASLQLTTPTRASHYEVRLFANNVFTLLATSGPVAVLVPPAGHAFPTFTLEAALGGSFRDNLINEAFNVATWPVADSLANGFVAHDIGGRGFHGVWQGFGTLQGISFSSIPEGLLGSTFNGNDFAQVPSEAAPDPSYNLSLAGGDVDIACIVKDVPIDATFRCIAAKQDVGANGNGWRLGIQNARINFYCKVGGVLLFEFVTGGAGIGPGEHIITAHYLTGLKRARIYVDGVVAAEVTGLSGAELAYTAAPLRIGAFTGAVAGDGSGFRGTLGYVSIGREGDETWSTRLMATKPWTDITADVRVGPNPITMRVGIPGTGPTDNVATTGTLSFTLDNSSRKHADGFYTPGHRHGRAGWSVGAPIRWTLHYGDVHSPQFHGRLSDVRPLPGVRDARYVDCTVTDWMDVAAASPLSAMQPLVNQPSHYCLYATLAQASGRSPVALEVHNGRGIFPFAGDTGEGETDTMLMELGRLATSENGFIYIRGAGTLRYEAHGERATKAVSAIFNQTMSALECIYTLQDHINIVRLLYTPRRVSGSNVVLYSLDCSKQPQLVKSGETRVIEGGYVDPANEAERIGAINLQPFTPVTDYKFTQNADGSGSDLTANLDVDAALGSNSFRLTLQNQGGADGYLHLSSTIALQVRGQAVYHYKPAQEERRDAKSVRARGPRVLTLELPYETVPAMAGDIAGYILGLYNRTDAQPTSMLVHANRDATVLVQALNLMVGDKIALREEMTGTTEATPMIIHEKQLTYMGGHVLDVTFTLAPSKPPVSSLQARLNIMRLGTSRLGYLWGIQKLNEAA